MRRVRQLVALLTIALIAAVSLATSARAGSPLVIPQTDYPGYPAGTVQHLSPPEKSDDYQYTVQQGRPIVNTQYSALENLGYFSIFGDMESDGRQIVWDDFGSGAPVIQGVLHRWQFPLPGLYGWHCSCSGQSNVNVRADGRIYVVGPRARINPVMTSPTNTPPVSYTLDGSESNVTDWKPYVITKYEWDLNEDGVYSGQPPDQSGPEPTAPITFETPGAHLIGLRVTDNFGSDPMTPGLPRVTDNAVTINVPKVQTASTITPPSDSVDTAAKKTVFSDTFKKAKVKLTVRGKISISALRKNGLLVKVSGIRNGDVVGAKLTKALKKKKKRTVASRSGRAAGTSITLRIRFKKSALKVLRAKPRAKSIRLAVKVEGSDGFSTTKAKNVKLG